MRMIRRTYRRPEPLAPIDFVDGVRDEDNTRRLIVVVDGLELGTADAIDDGLSGRTRGWTWSEDPSVEGETLRDLANGIWNAVGC